MAKNILVRIVMLSLMKLASPRSWSAKAFHTTTDAVMAQAKDRSSQALANESRGQRMEITILNESERIAKQLSVVAERLLLEVSQGLDWQWTRGEPPSSVNLDDVVLNKSLDSYEMLSKTWHFLDAVVDARWHGFEKVDGLSWDEAMRLLSIIAQN